MKESNDEQPDIPPALDKSEWGIGLYSSPALAIQRTRDGIGGNPRLYIDIKQHPLDDVADMAALMALCNEVLRRFDDPRAILREHITLLREVADTYGHDTAGIDDDRYARVHELAVALESMLPPEKPDAT